MLDRPTIAAAFALIALTAPALAQDWPARRAVTMVVPFATGGPVDTIGRILASGLGEALGQQVIVENVGGAGGMTGASVAKNIRRTIVKESHENHHIPARAP